MEQSIKELQFQINDVDKRTDIINIKCDQLKNSVDKAVQDAMELKLELQKHQSDLQTLHGYTKMREQHGQDISRLNADVIKLNEHLSHCTTEIAILKSSVEKMGTDLGTIHNTINEFPLKYEKITPAMTFWDFIKISPSFITVMIALATIIYYIIQHVGLFAK